MNTTGERVEITPELLRDIERECRARPVFVRPTTAGHPTQSLLLALVARIRELESELDDVYERQRDEAWERDTRS